MPEEFEFPALWGRREESLLWTSLVLSRDDAARDNPTPPRPPALISSYLLDEGQTLFMTFLISAAKFNAATRHD
jgi:hypothetical protein